MKRFSAVLVAVALLGLGIVLGRAVITSSNANGFAAAAAAGALPAAPELTLKRLDGTGVVSLKDLRGQVVVVNFWASWCNPCKDEAPILEDLWVTEAKAAGVAMIGVDTQDLSDDARTFAAEYGLTYPLVHDDGGEVARHWGVAAFPETFVIDRQGRAVAWFPGAVTAAGLREAIAKAKTE